MPLAGTQASTDLHIVQEESSQASAMFLAWLMGQPTGLRLLAASTPAALVVPPLQTLRHLILNANGFEDAAIAAVSQLRGLQTLKLAAKDNHKCESPKPASIHSSSVCTMQHFTELKRVHHQRNLDARYRIHASLQDVPANVASSLTMVHPK